MAESLRDLVVSLSLNSDNFSKNIKSINSQIREVESAFSLAAAGTAGFEGSIDGTAARVSTLEQKLRLQQQAVSQYEKALQAAQNKLQASADSHEKLTSKLDAQKQKYAELGNQIAQMQTRMKEIESGEQTDELVSEWAELGDALEKAKGEYAAVGKEIKDTEAKLTRLQSTMQKQADAVTQAETNLNRARASAASTEAELRRLEQELIRLQSGWTRAGDAMQAVGGKLESVGSGMENLGKKASVVSAAIVALGTKTVKTFASYDDSIRQVYATMGLSADTDLSTMQALDAAARETGATTKFTASQSAEALNYLALAGYDAQKAIETLPVVLNLAQAGGFDLASASDMVTDSMSALGLETSRATQFTDQMAVTAQKSNTSVQQLGEGILAVSGTAKNLKGGTVELNTALGILADNGIKSAEGGKHLRNTILSLQNPTDAAQKLLDQMGVKIYDVSGNMRGLDEIFADVNSGMAGWTQQAKDAALSEIFNKTDLNAVNALLSGSGARWKELSAAIANADGAAAQMGATMEGGIGGAFRNLSSAVEGLAIGFGDALAPTVQAIAERITNLVRSFSELDDGTKQTIAKTAALVAVAGPAMLLLGKITTGTGKLITGAGKLMAKIGELTAKVKTANMDIGAMLKTVAAGPAGYAALAAAAVGATAVLIDFATGARRAREALKDLDATVEAWGEDVQTAFEKAQGLSAFGLNTEDFRIAGDAVSDASDWLDAALKTWSDGKAETDEIVADTVSGFTEGTQSIREAMQSLRESGGGSLLGDLDGDIERLDAIDKEVSGIFQGAQNRLLQPEEIDRLQSLIDERGALEIKYQLVSDSADAFEKISQGVESALSRGADAGRTYSEAFAAATQGEGALIDALNAEYDARYAAAQAMTDASERSAAMDELSLWYDQQRAAAVQQYSDTLADIAAQTGVFSETGEYADTESHLTRIQELMAMISANGGNVNKSGGLLEELNGELSSMDESQLVELNAALSAMQMSAAQAGTELPAELQSISDALAAVKDMGVNGSDIFPEDISTRLKEIFGGLDEETTQVYANLNTDNLATAYDAWAAGSHADIIPSMDTSTIQTKISKLTVDGLTGTIGVVTGDGNSYDIKDITINPETGHVEAVTADGRTLDITDLNLSPETGHVEAVTADGQTLDITNLKLNPETGHVNAVTADGQTLDITNLKLNPETGHVNAVTADGQTLDITNLNLTPLTGVVNAVTIAPDAVIPEVNVTARVNFAEGKYTNVDYAQAAYDYADADVNAGKNTFFFESAEENLIAYAAALRQAAEAKESYDAAENGSMEQSDALTEMINAQQCAQTLKEQLQTLIDTGEGYDAFGQKIANGLQLIADGTMDADGIANLTALKDAITTISELDSSSIGSDITGGIAEGMNAYGYDSSASTVAGHIETALRSALQSSSPAERTKPIGNDASAGVGVGMTEYSFDGDASAAASNLQSAATAAFGTSLLRGAGVNAMTGLAAGIRAGTASVTSAIRTAARAAVLAAKSELVIKSPSHVFRDEIGVMTMRGFGEGVLRETEAQARVIRNAARYLTDEARGGVAGIAAAGSRQATYNQQSSVNLYVDNMNVRDQRDIKTLASEIASLTKRRQTGRGMA